MTTPPTAQRKRARTLIAAGAAAIAVALPIAGTQTIAHADTVAAANPDGEGYFLVQSPAGVQTGVLAEMLETAGFDLVGHGDSAAGVGVIGDRSTPAKLAARGLTATYTGPLYQPVPRSFRANADTYYGGYHTSEGHEKHNAAVASAHPELVKKYVIGQSWKKSAGKGGHDIEALCITKIGSGDCELTNTNKKPKFTLMSQMHSRELASGELSYMFIDQLVNNYGKDSEVTALLDSTEVWVIPIANPDGVDIVSSNSSKPVMQRKNAHENGCSGTGLGTDLNRNSDYHWDVNQGTKCSETYPGTGPDSEPETKGIEGLLKKIYRDTKPDSDNSPATKDTTGVFLTVHSYSQLNIFPYGWTNNNAPNHADLKAIADAMAQHNRYQVVHGDGGLNYFAPGATDDWVYGKLGVPGYTIEIGPGSGSCGGFAPAYSCMQNFWKLNYPAYVAAAKAAAKPYKG
ncbi:peptidase M14 [Pilimelia anulata]|uniref:Zinc carboxypeptidase n=1 Tax=Pilimelia anulata TaxID=53371 RepID=A0A8J3F720_9ACTN|nr:M14 family zinc carboxypeptidase [Pilimelia anulata]GGJ74531.1 peptidase M14 [Pilimelia anulata]